MTEEPFDLNVRGGKVRGFIHRPRKEATAAVVILHGWIGYCAGPHRILHELSEAIGDAGMAALRFDFFGRGDSDGQYEDTTFQHAVDDTRRVTAWAKRHLAVKRLGMAGICFGATVGWRCMDLWDTMVFLSPERVQRRATVLARLEALCRNSGRITRKVVSPQSWWRLLSGKTSAGGACRYYTKADVLPYAAVPPGSAPDNNCSALLILGEGDPVAQYVRKQYEGINRKLGVRCDTHIITGADHSFCSVEWKQAAISQAVKWLSGELRR